MCNVTTWGQQRPNKQSAAAAQPHQSCSLQDPTMQTFTRQDGAASLILACCLGLAAYCARVMLRVTGADLL